MDHGFRSLALIVAAAAMSVSALAAGNDAVERLAEQARFWEQRNRPELARDGWQRLLATDPRHHEALARLAMLAYAADDTATGDSYTARLRSIDPQSPWLRQIDNVTAVARIDEAALERARALAGTRRTSDALAAYRSAFGGSTPPTPALAVEYYQVMAGDESRFDEALAGIDALIAAHPGSVDYELIAARLRSYQQDSRRQAIDALARLQEHASIREPARAAWRQALIWLDARPTDLPRYERYLRIAGDDREVRQRADGLRERRPDPAQRQRDAEIALAFARFEAGDISTAETAFETLAQRLPRNADVLGGLGLVRLRQSRHTEADILLRQAMSARPAEAGRWRSAQRTAAFFSRFNNAQQMRQQGNLIRALDYYRAAFAEPPAELDPSLRVPYADALIEAGQLDTAEAQLRLGLRERPNDTDMLRSLAGLLMRAGRTEEAERVARQGPEEVRAIIAPAQAENLRQQAAASLARGDVATARNQLQQAIALAPGNPWIRLDLARLLRTAGELREADGLLDSLRQTHGDLPGISLAQAYIDVEAGRWLDALYELERLPPQERDDDARALQRRAWLNYQIERARIAAAQGDHETAWTAMSAADREADPKGADLPILAGGWAALGDPARALAYMRRSFEGRPTDVGQRIQYAALLLELGQDAEFESNAELLVGQPMTPHQARTLEDLIVGYRITLADRARERGDLAGAYAALREVVQRRPGDVPVQMALARIFSTAGDYRQALALYDAVLSREPERIDALYGAADAALASGDPQLAEKRVDAARRAAPRAAEADEFAARLAEVRGQRGRALRYYEAAARKRGRGDPAATAPKPPRLQLLSEDALGLPMTPRWSDGVPDAPPPTQPLRPRPSAFEVSTAPAGGGVGFPTTPGIIAEAPRGGELSSPPPRALSQRTSDLRADVSGWFGGAVHARVRDGEAGLSRLHNVEAPIALYSAETEGGRFGLRVVPVYADAGTVSGDRRFRFGALPLINGGAGSHTMTGSGVAASLVYSVGSFTADVGTTPLGFQDERITGGLRWAPAIGPWRLALDISRRPVADSLLSYSGLEDPYLRLNWGAINRSRARIDVAYDLGAWGIYGNFGFSHYDGRNTDDNSAGEVGAGFYSRAWRGENTTLTWGLNLTSFFYDKNRRYFSFGHGGYFSPQFFLGVTVPIELAGRHGDLSYRLHAALGLQTFREDGAPLFPHHPVLQNEIENLILAGVNPQLIGGYADNKSSGLGYAFGAELEYRLTPRLYLGGLASTDNARDFTEYHFSGFLRWYFNDQRGVPELPRPMAGHFNAGG